MKTKTKTLAATTMVALAVPGTALATGPGHDDKGKHGGDRPGHAEHRGDRGDRGEHRGHGKHKGDKGARGWRSDDWFRHGRKAFVVSGTDASGLTVTDGKLAGPITLDPQLVSRGAAKLLNLTKEQVRGEDTITFGTAGDAVLVKYKGLTATDALQPTDRVTVFGKVKDGTLDVKYVKVWRAKAQTPAPAPAPAPETPAPTAPTAR